MKHSIKELDKGQLELMWNFLRFDCGQKSDIPTLKRHLDMLRQAMIQKSGGQEKYLKHDGGKLRLSLVPAEAIEAIGTVMTHGAEKYGKDTYKQVEPDKEE